MQSFSIGVLKQRGKGVLQMNYWKYVVAALLLNLFITGRSAGVYDYDSAVDEFRNSGLGDSTFPDIFGPQYAAIWVLFAGVFITVFIIGILLSIFLFGPLEVGLRRVFVMGQREPGNLNNISVGFKINYWNVVKIIFFRNLYIFLWSLLFVIPGIVKGYEYRMIPYLLAENPNMSMDEAFGRTREMTYGDKWNIFVLDLSFIGWEILCAITLNIVRIFWVGPYEAATDAELYSALKYKTGYQPDPVCYTYDKPRYGYGYGGYGNQGAWNQNNNNGWQQNGQDGYGSQGTWSQNNQNSYGSQGDWNPNTWNPNAQSATGNTDTNSNSAADVNGAQPQNTASEGTSAEETSAPGSTQTDGTHPYDDSQNL